MSVQHHPEEALLLDYAAGRLDAPMVLIVATHLSFCASCRRIVALGERVGGLLLEDLEPAAMAGSALADTLARLDDVDTPRADAVSNDYTPLPLRAVLGRDLSDVRWRRLSPRLSYATLYRRGHVSVRLLRGAPGADVGVHTHRGMEYTLVLRGGFTDATGDYGPGDFQALSGEVTHNPVADPGEDCINLSVTTGRLKFEGLVHKVVGWLFGM